MTDETQEQPALTVLFTTDPLHLTKPDRSRIVAYYQENRERFKAEGPTRKKAEPKGPKLTSLADLDLKI